jgi:hypothetical protein
VGALELTQSVVTLGEAFLATIVLSLYFDWSRGGFPGRWWGATPRRQLRVWYYVVVAGFTALVYQEVVRNAIGEGAVEWLQINAEAYAAMLLLPIYFDVVGPLSCAVANGRRWAVRGAWYGVLVGFPLFIQAGAAESVLGESLAEWCGQTTEVFLAGVVISLYFDVIEGGVVGTVGERAHRQGNLRLT